MAHAYHHQVLGFDNARIREAYARYLELSPKEKEFFAEFTEPYFGTNDFYPFVAGELKKEFPHVCDLMEEIWGPLPF